MGDELPEMTAAEFRAIRVYLGLSIGDVARGLDVDSGTVRDWDKGKRAMPPGVVLEFSAWREETEKAIDYLVRQHTRVQVRDGRPGRIAIPRTPVDLERWALDRKALGLSFWPSLDWWKVVAVQVVEEVPGLRIVWE
ncbi:helix-turn-helix domain-containing protein [Brevibacterium moorei]|uniref:helix-turn-helix domain-containing protein n=1 Tax=Brevibacterium moorei TaxID=2968457 RepID=UPI00211B86F3|nr:hypothetical protein [Brevibacterium sp. 68QC2CO]MCQ9384432.1 hypothetical protein [Brevibacterium sp. 68QC2CO]